MIPSRYRGIEKTQEDWNTDIPEEGEYIITWTGTLNGYPTKPFLEIAEFNSGWDVHHIEKRGYRDVEVTAWMPLPEPYKGE